MISLRKSSADVALDGRPALPQVNLLPPEIAQRRGLRRLQAGLGGVVVLAVLAVGLGVVLARGQVSDAQEDVNRAQAQQALVQAESARYRDVTATYKQAADAQALLVLAMGQEVRYSRLLNALAVTLPANVWLSDVTVEQETVVAAAGTGGSTAPPSATTTTVGTTTATGAAAAVGTLKLEGVAFEHEDVANWLESVANGQGLSTPLLQESTERLLGSKQAVQWTASLSLSPAALSGRYTSGG